MAAVDGNLSSLQQQAGSLSGQIGQVDGQIAQLETEQAQLAAKLQQKKALLNQTIREAYVAGEPSSVEVIASNQSFSGVVGQQHYRDQVSDKTAKAAKDVAETQDQIDQKVSAAKEKRDGLVAMKSSLDEKVATAQAQEAAKAALAAQSEADFKKAQEAIKQEQASGAIATAPSSRPGGGGSGPVQGIGGGRNPYPFGQCTYYVYSVTGRGQNGNAGTWRPTSSTPAVGKIMIWRAGEQGASGAGHVGYVYGVSGNTVMIRHMNWGGGPGVVTTGTFQSTGKFY